MAVRSIIDIDVQDEAFKRFQEAFEEYDALLKSQPETIQKTESEFAKMEAAVAAITAVMGEFTSELKKVVAANAEIQQQNSSLLEGAHKAAKGQEKVTKEVRRSTDGMKKLAHASKEVGLNIFNVTKWMLKWGTLGGGLAGIAGGVGLDDLAYSALSRQRSARGIGMTPGQQAAFQTYFGQFGATQGVESGIANARNDVSKRWIFSGLGITSHDLATKSNFALAIEAERRAQQIVKAAPRGEWENIAQARGLTQAGFTMEQLRVLRHTSAASLNRAAAGAAGSVNALGFTPGVAREWTQFSIALRRAGVEIESSLIVGLHKLAGPLKTISGDVAKWIAAFARGPEMGKIIGDVSTDLQKFVSFIGSSKFQTDVAQFSAAIAQLSRETVSALRYFHLIPGATINDSQRIQQAVATPKSAPHAGWAAHIAAYADKHLGMGPSKQSIYAAAVAAHKKYPDVPVHEMMKLASIESSMGKNMLGPKTAYGRAEGPWQMMPGTAKAMGAHDIMGSVNNAAMGTARYLHLLGKQFGSQKVALAAYEAGPGTVAAQMKAHPHHWLASAGPAERKETTAAAHHSLPAKVERLIDTLRRQKPMRPQQVTIRNQTSARVAIQANAAAY